MSKQDLTAVFENQHIFFVNRVPLAGLNKIFRIVKSISSHLPVKKTLQILLYPISTGLFYLFVALGGGGGGGGSRVPLPSIKLDLDTLEH